ncbi:hypothetical protein C8R43DRAFT_942405 [Mycena crocata]|nr:hypothetical protein C8R43DRAFT_942405 [Mycena crocata]
MGSDSSLPTSAFCKLPTLVLPEEVFEEAKEPSYDSENEEMNMPREFVIAAETRTIPDGCHHLPQDNHSNPTFDRIVDTDTSSDIKHTGKVTSPRHIDEVNQRDPIDFNTWMQSITRVHFHSNKTPGLTLSIQISIPGNSTVNPNQLTLDDGPSNTYGSEINYTHRMIVPLEIPHASTFIDMERWELAHTMDTSGEGAQPDKLENLHLQHRNTDYDQTLTTITGNSRQLPQTQFAQANHAYDNLTGRINGTTYTSPPMHIIHCSPEVQAPVPRHPPASFVHNKYPIDDNERRSKTNGDNNPRFDTIERPRNGCDEPGLRPRSEIIGDRNTYKLLPAQRAEEKTDTGSGMRNTDPKPRPSTRSRTAAKAAEKAIGPYNLRPTQRRTLHIVQKANRMLSGTIMNSNDGALTLYTETAGTPMAPMAGRISRVPRQKKTNPDTPQKEPPTAKTTEPSTSNSSRDPPKHRRKDFIELSPGTGALFDAWVISHNGNPATTRFEINDHLPISHEREQPAARKNVMNTESLEHNHDRNPGTNGLPEAKFRKFPGFDRPSLIIPVPYHDAFPSHRINRSILGSIGQNDRISDMNPKGNFALLDHDLAVAPTDSQVTIESTTCLQPLPPPTLFALAASTSGGYHNVTAYLHNQTTTPVEYMCGINSGTFERIPTELLSEIALHLPMRDRIRLGRTSKFFRNVTHRALFTSAAQSLRRYNLSITDFQFLQSSTGTIAAGPILERIINLRIDQVKSRSSEPLPSDSEHLDLYCPTLKGPQVANFIRHATGYSYGIYEASDPGCAVSRAFRLTNEGLPRINVFETQSDHPIDAIIHLSMTPEMGAWTLDSIWHGYPAATSDGLAMATSTRLSVHNLTARQRTWDVLTQCKLPNHLANEYRRWLLTPPVPNSARICSDHTIAMAHTMRRLDIRRHVHVPQLARRLANQYSIIQTLRTYLSFTYLYFNPHKIHTDFNHETKTAKGIDKLGGVSLLPVDGRGRKRRSAERNIWDRCRCVPSANVRTDERSWAGKTGSGANGTRTAKTVRQGH